MRSQNHYSSLTHANNSATKHSCQQVKVEIWRTARGGMQHAHKSVCLLTDMRARFISHRCRVRRIQRRLRGRAAVDGEHAERGSAQSSIERLYVRHRPEARRGGKEGRAASTCKLVSRRTRKYELVQCGELHVTVTKPKPQTKTDTAQRGGGPWGSGGVTSGRNTGTGAVRAGSLISLIYSNTEHLQMTGHG